MDKTLLSMVFVIFSLINPWVIEGFMKFRFDPLLDDIGPESLATTRNVSCTEDMFYEQFPDPSDCRHYFLCLWGRLSREKCPVTTAFHPVYGCIQHTQVKNCGRSSCAVDGIYEDPKNCTRYNLCLLGEAYQFTCPERTTFNSTMITCSKSDDTSCSNGNNGTSQISSTPVPPPLSATEIPLLKPTKSPTPISNINASVSNLPSIAPMVLEPIGNISLGNGTMGN